MGRIAGDTAIVVVLLGATLQLEPEGSVPGLEHAARAPASTLTSYVYNNSPAGEGNAPQKAYAAAFVLLLIVIALNFAVDADRRRGARTGLETARLEHDDRRRPTSPRRTRDADAPRAAAAADPADRVDAPPTVAPPTPSSAPHGARARAPRGAGGPERMTRRASSASPTATSRRSRRSRCRSARARCSR